MRDTVNWIERDRKREKKRGNLCETIEKRRKGVEIGQRRRQQMTNCKVSFITKTQVLHERMGNQPGHVYNKVKTRQKREEEVGKETKG